MVTLNFGRGGWLAVVLLLSLGLNVFLGGIFVGRWLSPPNDQPRLARAENSAPAGRFLKRLTANLEPADRDTVISTVRARAPELKAAQREVGRARRAVMARIHATPFDRAALDDALVTMRDKQNAIQSMLQGAIADAIMKLPDGARRRLGPRGRRDRRDRRR
jgi:uncharacterized membrane protein